MTHGSRQSPHGVLVAVADVRAVCCVGAGVLGGDWVSSAHGYGVKAK